MLGLALFVGLSLAFAPAQLVALLIGRGPVQMLAPTGSFWSGGGKLVLIDQKLGDLELGDLVWQFKPGALLRGHLAFAVLLQRSAAQASATQITATIELGPRSLVVSNLNGVIANALLARAASHYDVELQGDLKLTQLNLQTSRDRITAAQGELFWAGGHVNYVLNGQNYAANLGALHGRVGSFVEKRAPDRLVLDVDSVASHAKALRFTLSEAGWGSAAVTRQFMASAGFPWQGNAAPEEFVLEVQEKLF